MQLDVVDLRGRRIRHLANGRYAPGTHEFSWDGRDDSGAHHVGVWVDSVVDDTERLVSEGWTLVGAERDPSDGNGFGVFSYVRPPSGLIVELVDRAVLAHFEQWWNAALT